MVQASPFLGLSLGGMEWVIILVIVLLLFGNRIPGLARSLGKGINEFKAGLREGDGKPQAPGGTDKPESRT